MQRLNDLWNSNVWGDASDVANYFIGLAPATLQRSAVDGETRKLDNCHGSSFMSIVSDERISFVG